MSYVNVEPGLSSWQEDDGPLLCYASEQSAAFLFLTAVTAAAIAVFAVSMAIKRKPMSGMDVLASMIMVAGIVRFLPKVWDSLHVFGLNHYTQTACKLAVFTTVGAPHVVSFLVLLTLVYASRALRAGDARNADEWVRSRLGWIVLFLFALEGATGMAPAIYADASVDAASCGQAQGMDMSASANAIGHLVLVSVLPYIVPFLLMMYPMSQICAMTRAKGGVEENYAEEDGVDQMKDVKTRAENALAISVTYIVAHLPMAVAALVTYPMMAKGFSLNWSLLCQFESFLHFIEDAWFLALPILLLVRDAELGRELPGRRYLSGVGRRLESVLPFRRGSVDEFQTRLS
jgi:hypothetical protein